MTIILSNMLDSDCQVLRCTWQNISDVNVVEITSKNIYNLSLYKIKKDWLENKSYKVLNNLYDYMKDENCYKALNRNCSQ